jgi:hypothetical protein
VGFFVCGMMGKFGQLKESEMKKLYPLLSVLFLIYWGCEEEQEVDTTPPK